MEVKNHLNGGEFIIHNAKLSNSFIPEEFSEEQRMIADMCQDFLEKEVFPNLDRIDAQEKGLMPSLLKKTGELGLLGLSIPEEYGGYGQSFVTSMIAADVLGAGHSYAVAYSADTGIGTLPLLYYGSDELKQKYLPQIASGELLTAYCLTEPGAGSDANSGRTRAVLSEDGKHYILNGQKMWITNGGFADILTVFAKVDNDKILSCFLVERNTPGVTFGAEEHKMGIKGSSTVQIFFNDCKIPVENMIGKRGEGFRIALNILHIGRIKLGANVIGSIKRAINHSVQYANERKQFGQLISNFGAIKYKLAEQVIRCFANESALYRTSAYVDEKIHSEMEKGKKKEEAYLEAIGEYALEAAVLKVLGSEVLDYVTDEAVQIHGGMGFSAEMPVDRCYRDSRINRIFEGTNEINRLVVADQYLKMAKKSDSPIFAMAKELYNSIDSIKPASANDYFDYKVELIENFKKAVLLTQYCAYETLGKQYSGEQEIQMNISDMIIQTYATESLMLRVKKLTGIKAESEIGVYKDILDAYIQEAALKIYSSAIEAICSFASESEYSKLQKALQNLTTFKPINSKDAHRRIAEKLIEDNIYKF
ncbi:MAG TPA: acyl-CoA dehydrogenase family protein [Bacteroidales bacterium]|jgi:alkylation response protein AidB-like acyl-CoA dehydrogenase|nr:acyl-CoA dehydrogenase family protein [Bacteroidales bacterium]